MKASERKVLTRIKKIINKSKSFFLAGHEKPDGDTIGAALAFGHFLARMRKKKVDIYSRHPLPKNLEFLSRILPGIKVASFTDKNYDTAIILECSNFGRMGNIIKPSQVKNIINIDHHTINNPFGTLNYINPRASSSCELVYQCLKFLGARINQDIAMALYTGLVTDTGKFQQENTTAECLRIVAELIDGGLDTARISQKIFQQQSLGSLHLLGNVLKTLQLHYHGQVATLELPERFYQITGAAEENTEGIINYGLLIPTVELVLFFRDTERQNIVKVSLRSRTKFDVSQLVKPYDGGGHRHAAGCSVAGTIAEVKQKFLQEIAGYFRRKKC